MALTPGTRLGPYEIVSALGAGGMGEVYKARDTRLDRTVAIKVLPEHVASDPELKQRFEREAKTISSLNHPHICTLYDVGNQDGVDFLVMEDKRSDVWAFGAVLYEMLTGRRAFDAEDVAQTLARVLEREPDWMALPATTPPTVTAVLRRCLQKDRKQRARDIGDVSLALEGAFEMGALHGAEAAAPQPAAWLRPAPVALLTAVVIGLAVWGVTRPTPQPAAPIERFVVTTPTAELNAQSQRQQSITISPDGTRIVYLTGAVGNNQLYVRPVGQLEGYSLFSAPTVIDHPTVSPDGAWVLFADAADDTWKKVSVLGGPPLTLFPNPGAPRGVSFGPDDTIIFAQFGTGLFRGPAGGGEPTVLTTPDAERGEIGHSWPEVLPGGEAVLFTVVHGAGAENMELAVLDLATMEQQILLPGGTHAQYAATGHLVYGADDTLLAVPFDLDRLEVTGDPVPLLDGVTITQGSGAVEFRLSANGSLLYVTGDPSAASRTLVWVDRQGREEPLAAPPRRYLYPRLSPDGTRVALDVRDQELDIWIWDLTRGGPLTRFTFDAAQDQYPVWTPDATRVVFSSQADGEPSLYWKAADGTGTVERLSESGTARAGYSFSPDGESLVFREARPDGGRDLRVLSLAGDRGVETLLGTEFSEGNGEISRDGRWIAYESNQSGQMEVYVRPFPDVDGGGQWQISTGGGTQPLWASDGRELFYRHGGEVMAVSVQTEPSFTPGTPEVMFEGDYVLGAAGRNYDVSPDGLLFLMIKEGGGAEDTSAPSQIILVKNWFEELRRLVPTD